MNNGHLVSAASLLRHLDDPDWRIVDCRFDLADPLAGAREYREGHIPGSAYADLNENLASEPTPETGRHPLPNIADLEAFFGGMAVRPTSKVVVYDSGNGAIAARCWWLLRWLGHDNVRVLDGGIAHWQILGLPTSTEILSFAATRFVGRARGELVMTTSELVADKTDIEAVNLLDARDQARFRGEVEPIDPVAGHIPGARNQPFLASLDSDGMWRSAEDLEAMMAAQLGPDKTIEWTVMCGSGVTACHLAISGMQAGYREPRLYVGSWSEWIRDQRRPIGLGND